MVAKTLTGTIKWIGAQSRTGRPQPVAQLELLPGGLVPDLLIIGEEWVRKHERHQSSSVRHAVAVECVLVTTHAASPCGVCVLASPLPVLRVGSYRSFAGAAWSGVGSHPQALSQSAKILWPASRCGTSTAPPVQNPAGFVALCPLRRALPAIGAG